jgi:hypothetical protein
MKDLPASIRSCFEDGGWTFVQKPNKAKFQILSKSEYAEQYASIRFRETCVNMADRVSMHCIRIMKMQLFSLFYFPTLLWRRFSCIQQSNLSNVATMLYLPSQRSPILWN